MQQVLTSKEGLRCLDRLRLRLWLLLLFLLLDGLLLLAAKQACGGNRRSRACQQLTPTLQSSVDAVAEMGCGMCS